MVVHYVLADRFDLSERTIFHVLFWPMLAAAITGVIFLCLGEADIAKHGHKVFLFGVMIATVAPFTGLFALASFLAYPYFTEKRRKEKEASDKMHEAYLEYTNKIQQIKNSAGQP